MCQAGSVAITSYILRATLEIENETLFLVASRGKILGGGVLDPCLGIGVPLSD